MKKIKKISIRGRFAIVLTCAKLLLQEEGLHKNKMLRKMINKIATFTMTDDLSDWEYEMRGYMPYYEYKKGEEVLKDLKKYEKIEVFEVSFYNKVLSFYSNPKNELITKTLEACEKIGRSELYGSIQGHAEESYCILKEILTKTSLENKFDFDKIAKNHPFKEVNGWGKRFEFKNFKRN